MHFDFFINFYQTLWFKPFASIFFSFCSLNYIIIFSALKFKQLFGTLCIKWMTINVNYMCGFGYNSTIFLTVDPSLAAGDWGENKGFHLAPWLMCRWLLPGLKNITLRLKLLYSGLYFPTHWFYSFFLFLKSNHQHLTINWIGCLTHIISNRLITARTSCELG